MSSQLFRMLVEDVRRTLEAYEVQVSISARDEVISVSPESAGPCPLLITVQNDYAVDLKLGGYAHYDVYDRNPAALVGEVQAVLGAVLTGQVAEESWTNDAGEVTAATLNLGPEKSKISWGMGLFPRLLSKRGPSKIYPSYPKTRV